MRRRCFGFCIVLMLTTGSADAAVCKLERYAELPVTMAGTRPLVAGSINGVGAFFIADSGAFYSMLTREGAQSLKLRLQPLPSGLVVSGIGGAADARLASVGDFTLAGFGSRVFHNVQFVVVGNAFATEAAGLIGQNVLGHADTEYDLANGFIRLFHTRDCAGQPLAYWSGSAAVAMVEIGYTSDWSPHLIGTAKLNGIRIRVVFDSGAARSMLSLKTAARAGVKPGDAEVLAGGLSSGIGRQLVETWLARFDSLDIGGEEVKNARLRLADIESPGGADMLLGADFFLSHRIFVAASQHRIYFTYNGGHVFDLSVTDAPEPSAASGAGDAAQAPANAEGFRRRGAAFAARADYRSAIADFDQAIRLEPGNSQNYDQRAVARWRDHQTALAMSDFDASLTIKPDDIAAMMGRGALRLADNDEAGASADFDAVTRLAPGDASLGLRIAQSYVYSGHFAQAVQRFDRWIAQNPKDDRLPAALNGRCWSRAVMNQGLDLALADCNAALRAGSRNSEFLASRAMVWLRLRQLDKSIADYRTSLALQPKSAGSLYGLGIAESSKGLKEQGDKDIQDALRLSPSIAEQFGQIGLTR